jgi:hypothetical protein
MKHCLLDSGLIVPRRTTNCLWSTPVWPVLLRQRDLGAVTPISSITTAGPMTCRSNFPTVRDPSIRELAIISGAFFYFMRGRLVEESSFGWRDCECPTLCLAGTSLQHKHGLCLAVAYAIHHQIQPVPRQRGNEA